jgi:hypothetical protein
MTPSRKPEAILVNGKPFACLPPRTPAPSKPTHLRPYVGTTEDGRMVVFQSDTVPTEATHGDRFVFTTGPFRTMRAARLMAEGGKDNPHTVTVAQCERLARQEARK